MPIRLRGAHPPSPLSSSPCFVSLPCPLNQYTFSEAAIPKSSSSSSWARPPRTQRHRHHSAAASPPPTRGDPGRHFLVSFSLQLRSSAVFPIPNPVHGRGWVQISCEFAVSAGFVAAPRNAVSLEPSRRRRRLDLELASCVSSWAEKFRFFLSFFPVFSRFNRSGLREPALSVYAFVSSACWVLIGNGEWKWVLCGESGLCFPLNCGFPSSWFALSLLASCGFSWFGCQVYTSWRLACSPLNFFSKIP